MMNELVFLIYTLLVSGAALGALLLGKEALVSLIVLNCVLANLFVTKQIILFSLNATASDALAVGATIGLNLLQEFFGRELALKAVWISFFGALYYTVVSVLHITYLPSILDMCHGHFCEILKPMPRLVAASLIVYFIVQQLDCRLYGFLRKKYHGKHFIIRNYISISSTQLLDTILFSFLGLYGIVENIGQIIVISYAIKLATLLFATPMIAMAKKIYQK